MEANQAASSRLLTMTADIVAAYVGANAVLATELPELIESVHGTLRRLGDRLTQPLAPVLRPAVTIKKSITPDFLICLEDGKRFRSLKRHLRSHYNLSAEEYRTKWGLDPDYPMVAPAYARERSQLAKKMGLGQQRRRRTP